MKTKRLLSGLITVAMLLSLCVTTAFAANSGYKAGLTVEKKDENKLSVSCDAGPSGTSVNIQAVQTFIVAFDLEVLKPLLKNGTKEISLGTFPEEKAMAYEVWENPDTLATWHTKVYPYKSSDGKVGFMLIQPANGETATLTETVSLAKVYLGFQTGKSYADVKEDTVRFATAAELKGMSEDKAIRFNDGTDANGFEWSNGEPGKDTLTFAPGNEPKVVAKGFTFAPSTPATKTLDSIAVTTAPTKTTYTAGENFDPADMVVTATYNDSSTAAVTTYTVTDGNSLTAGKTSVTISYTEGGVTKTCTQAITVNAAPKTLDSIAVKTAPTKTTYTAGENFDPAGMVIEATYNDGSTAAVTGYTVTDGNSLTAGKTTVTISYTEGSETKTCTQTITVKVAPKTLSSIAVTTAPTKTTYTAGENFDPAGMVVTATYSDGSTAAVTTYTVTDGNSLTAGKTSVTISYTEGGVTKTCTQAITVNAAPPAPTEYTITFNVNGGIGTIPSQTTSGQKLSSLPTATHSGSYSFVGWYASDGTQITTAYVFSANTTVYAHWTYIGGVGSYTPSYSVSVDKTENGTITVSPKSASKGSIVTITVKPDKGYTLETLRALDMSGYAMELTENNGRFTFKMPASAVIVKATFMDDNTMLNFFVDVKASDYFYDAVLWAAEKGVTSGADALHFSPNAPCTRAQIVTFLWRAAGSPEPKTMSSFADVPADAFYAKAVAWAVENGITGGTGDGKFSPDATCTRAQAVTFLYRASGAPAVSGNAAFSDVATNAYYAAAVKWAEKNGITGGIGGGLFGSGNDCTRAQIVTFLYRSVK